MRIKSIAQKFFGLLKKNYKGKQITGHVGEKQLLFAFGGRTQFWFGMGRGFFKEESVFKSIVLECNEIIKKLVGQDILENFESENGEEFYKEEDKVILTICVIQIALYELWKSKGIYPDAVMGVSLGELPAVYAAGGLTLEETLKICSSILLINKLEAKEYHTIILETTLANSIQLCMESPVRVYPILEVSLTNTGLFCHENDVEYACKYFTQKKINWKMAYNRAFPYHTALLNRHEHILKERIRSIAHKPLQCNYYSASIGKSIPTLAVLPSDYWYNMFCSPVLQFTILEAALIDGYNLIVQVCAFPFLKTPSIERFMPGKEVSLLHSMSESESEIETFYATHKRVIELKHQFKPCEDAINIRFIQSLNLADKDVVQNPYPYITHLRNLGAVHFLPSHNVWIVLDYDDVDSVLKQAESFSNLVYKEFDSLLVGADPPAHTKVRNLLQPLFSAQAFKKVGDFTTLAAESLVKELQNRKELDFVKDFSIPLSQAVISFFLGMSEDDSEKLRAYLGENLYKGSYWNELEVFFTEDFRLRELGEENNALNLLLVSIKDNCLTIKEAVGLMRLIWSAGMATTSTLISNSVYLLLKNPMLADQMRENTQIIPKFIEECLRLETSATEIARLTLKDVNVAGQQIPAGSGLMLSLRAANRDPKHFENPHELDLYRPAKRNLSFGTGIHHCIGMGLARIETKNALHVVLTQLPALRLHPLDGPVFVQVADVRSMTSLPLIYN